MTWNDLCWRATKEFGYYIGNGLMHPDKYVFFFENGSVGIGEEVFTHRTYEQMLQIMEALR
jgi:hypothetical protein